MMQQALVLGPERPLKVVSVPIPEAPPKGVLLKTVYAGICHTELHTIEDSADVIDKLKAEGLCGEGFVMGHEVSGIIEEFGAEVTEHCGLRKGDRVSVFASIGCGHCEMCLNDCSNHCAIRYGPEKKECTTFYLGFGINDGGFQQYVRIPDCKYAVKLPESISMQVGAMLTCGGLTSYEALKKATHYIDIAIERREKARVIILGTGGVGQWAIVLAEVIFSGKPVEVIAADICQDKLELAQKLGADDGILLDIKEDADTSAEKIISKGRIDAVLDFVGNELTARIGIASLHCSGTYICVGIGGGDLGLPLKSLVLDAISVQGSLVGGLKNLKELIEFVAKHEVATPPIEYYTLDACNVAIDKLRAGKVSGRALIKFE